MFTLGRAHAFGIGCLGSRLLSGTMSSRRREKVAGQRWYFDRGVCADSPGLLVALETVKLREITIGVRGIAHRTGPSAGEEKSSAWNCYRHCSPCQPAHHDRGLRRTRGWSTDARSPRRFVRGCGAGPGNENAARSSEQWILSPPWASAKSFPVQ